MIFFFHQGQEGKKDREQMDSLFPRKKKHFCTLQNCINRPATWLACSHAQGRGWSSWNLAFKPVGRWQLRLESALVILRKRFMRPKCKKEEQDLRYETFYSDRMASLTTAGYQDRGCRCAGTQYSISLPLSFPPFFSQHPPSLPPSLS